MVAAYIFLALAVMSYVFMPLFGPQKLLDARSRRANRRLQLLEERERVYETIRDLDFDYRTGKVEESDYRASRSELTARAVDVLKQLDQVKEDNSGAASRLDDRLEKEIASARRKKGRKAKQAGLTCSSCGAKTPADARFCPGCGKGIAVG